MGEKPRSSSRTALVTGASSGIGASLARQLAERGYDLIINARREKLLVDLAGEITGSHGVRVTPLPLDLAAPGAGRLLYDRTEGAGLVVDVLINNAGFANCGFFAEIPWEQTEEQIGLNIAALTELTWRFVRTMRERERGHILNVASAGAYMPVPYYATYAAGKAYVRNFTEALAHELRHSRVRVCCLCPGPTATGFWEAAGQSEVPQVVKSYTMSADRVARIGLEALFGGRRNVVAGIFNKTVTFFMRLVPRRIQARLGAQSAGKEIRKRS